MALLALRFQSVDRRPSTAGSSPPVFALRLLIANNCQNTTPQGLVEALDHFPNLAFLDLSGTPTARDQSVLAKLSDLPSLQVLKLQNIRLRDGDVMVLADAIGKRVRSLDVANNLLTDDSINKLLPSCFDRVEDNMAASSGSRPRTASNLAVEDWPPGFVRPDPTLLDEFKDESYNDRFIRRLTSTLVSRLPFEDLPQSGITHLYISGNRLSVTGLAALMASKRLYVLDAGFINTAKAIQRSRSNPLRSPSQGDGDYLSIPGVQKVTPVFSRCCQEMTSLRIDHTIVTNPAPPEENNVPLAICELATDDHQQPAELQAAVPSVGELDDTAPPLYELDSRELAPAYELSAVPVDSLRSVHLKKATSVVDERQQAEIHRGSVYAPEVDNRQEEAYPDSHEQPVLTATGLGPMAQAMNGVTGSTLSPVDINSRNATNLAESDSSLSRMLIEKQRRELRSEQLSKPHGLVPGMIPKLRSLVLTNVPCHEDEPKVTNALISFLHYCSSEAQLAADEARLEQNPSRRPRQRASLSQHHHHHHQSAHEIFALQRIVLEMRPADEPVRSMTGMQSSPSLRSSSGKPFRGLVVNRTKSSTEDADSEAMWSASENDFTFFDDEEECGLPAAESLHNVPFTVLSEKIIVPTTTAAAVVTNTQHSPQQIHTRNPTSNSNNNNHSQKDGEFHPIDIVKEIAAFRKARKTAFEQEAAAAAAAAAATNTDSMRSGGVREHHHVEGYWPGEVKVVRGRGARRHGLLGGWGAAAGSGGGGDMLDYYANSFDERGVYR